MKTKLGYLKFIKWEKDNAIFEEANISDLIICGLGLNHLSKILNIPSGDILIIKSKYLPDKPITQISKRTRENNDM